MEAEARKTFRPFSVWAEAAGLWLRNMLPLIALSSVSLLLARMVYLSRPLWSIEAATPINIALSVFFVLEFVAAFVAHAFISLLIINHLKKEPVAGRVVFPSAFEAAAGSLLRYVQTVVVLLALIFVAVNLAAFLLGLGEAAFRAPGGDRGAKLAILIGAGTFFVVALIAVFWYGFFFSLAPLVAAYEKKSPWQAIRESRNRVKGNALRYLATLFMFVVWYVGLGVIVVKILLQTGASRFVINMIDPVLLMIFGPLWLALWYVSYEKLTEIKDKAPRLND
jgi:hypothetical protein